MQYFDLLFHSTYIKKDLAFGGGAIYFKGVI
jgi:predicted outer membrane repeat protein